MSISAAVAELNKEIAALGKTITEAQKTQTRLIAHRDALLKENQMSAGSAVVKKGAAGKRPGRPVKKAAAAKKTASVKKAAGTKKAASAMKTTASKKRMMSPEGRQRIAEAQKRRWAEQKKAQSE